VLHKALRMHAGRPAELIIMSRFQGLSHEQWAGSGMRDGDSEGPGVSRGEGNGKKIYTDLLKKKAS